MNIKTLATICSAISLFSLSFASAALADETNRASKVLTPEIASKVLGGTVKASLSNTMADTEMGKIWVSNSHYSIQGGPQISLLIRHAASKDEAKNNFEQSKGIYKGVTVEGLGDAAYRTAEPPQLDVLKGSNWLIISVGTLKAPDTAGQEKAARELLPKVAAD